MIMQWKQQGNDYTASWQGIHFVLFEHPTTKRWNLFADGKQVRQTWSKARLAMEQIDGKQQALVLKASRAQAPRLSLELHTTSARTSEVGEARGH
jgi:ATP-dependent helicase YprA (DUF1998 family)